MIHEKAYGIIPLKKNSESWQVLLVKHVKGHYWSFPKGHPQVGETPTNAAIRELFEETGLNIVSFLSAQLFREVYDYQRENQPICKEVFYYLAEVNGIVSLQTSEVNEFIWIDLKDAEQMITFSQSKALLKSIIEFIEGRD